MNMKKTGASLQEARLKRSLTRQELGRALSVPEQVIADWECGLACPELTELKHMAVLFGCSITDLAGDSSGPDGLPADFCDLAVSPLLFGDNLEHTRGCVNGGISAEILRNRKFVGKPGRYGCAHEWYSMAEKRHFAPGTANEYLYFGAPYTRHAEGYRMHRSHECNAQYITNYGGIAGMGQKDLYFRAGTEYRFTAAVKASAETVLTVSLLGSDGSVYDSKTVTANTGDYSEESLVLTSVREDWEGRLEITFDTAATVMIGAVSLMPCDHFHGMRKDVIARMKELGIRLLRWPGGNFAGEYNWKDGLLPRNMRAPLQSYLWLETQPHTDGYDFHEISTDDFVALCREIGAEPFITLNPTWNTPEESAQWVEYCNGDVNTVYGRRRAENGHPEPYNVQFWSLGNEAGYGHMEGANTADAYAKAVREHAVKMLEVSPGLTLCSSGPYPNQEWADYSANALADEAPAVSLHHYTGFPAFMDPDRRKEDYEHLVGSVEREFLPRIHRMREVLNDDRLKISFDEWNAWYAWYRRGSVSEGIMAASYLNMLFRNADRYGVMMACHFESVNEGSIKVYPDHAELSPTGQAISVMQHHAGGRICVLDEDLTVTQKGSVITCTLLNRSYDQEKTFTLKNSGEVMSAVLYSSDDVIPNTVFGTSDLPVKICGEKFEVVLPAHSMGLIRIQAV